MSYRCINAFEYGDVIYPGGQLVGDDNPILETHADFFAKVDEPSPRLEVATAAPGEKRDLVRHQPAKKSPAKKATRPVETKPETEGDN